MARTVSGAMSTAQASRLTQPGYLAQIDWPVVVRLCTRGTASYFSQTWVGGALKVKNVQWAPSGVQKASIQLLNSNGAYGIVVLGNGVADTRIRLWAFDAAATADADPVLVFDGVGDDASINQETVAIDLVTQRSGVLFSPRSYITQDAGFSITPQEGRSITWGGQRYAFSRKS